MIKELADVMGLKVGDHELVKQVAALRQNFISSGMIESQNPISLEKTY